MSKDPKTTYAQSSDIKSRTYIQYRKDMKRKAIAELEVIEWLERKLKEKHPDKSVEVFKSGGDAFLWFLRKGGVSGEPDFTAKIDEKELQLEFQYAEKKDLDFYDFKVSKVAKKKDKKHVPRDTHFVYIHKPLLKYAIIPAKWIHDNGEYGMVAAWKRYAFRVAKEKFLKILKDDETLKPICKLIDIKNSILDFQHQLIDLTKDKLSHLLQKVIDENVIVEIIPEDLNNFFQICFILDNINRVPKNVNIWLIYLLIYITPENTLKEIFKITYCIDFLYSKIEEPKPNELNQLVVATKKLMAAVKKCSQPDGYFKSSPNLSPIEELRYALFSINLLEDITQDMIHYHKIEELKPIKKIYANVPNLEKVATIIKKTGI